MIWFIVKLVGEPIAKKALAEFTSPGVNKLKELLFEPKEDAVQVYLEKLNKQMQELAQSLDRIELRQIFIDYNRADEELSHLFELYYAQKDKPLEDRDRQNTCSYILNINKGVSERARRMVGAFRHINLPSYKTLLQEYSDNLIEKKPDVYSYCDKVSAVMNHLRMNLIEAKILREKCYEDIIDKDKATDLTLTQADMQSIEDHYAEVAGPAEELREQFERFTKPGKYVRLKHHASSKYLTIYEEGKSLSPEKPFDHYREDDIVEKRINRGMPQVFLYQLGRGQEEAYTVTRSSYASTTPERVTVKIDGTNQEWQVIKLAAEKAPVKFVLQLRGREKGLDGVNDGRVYVSALPRDRGNEYMWWQPIMSKDGDGKLERGVFMLKHFRSEFALDADNLRVYAESRKPDYGNHYMKWSLTQRDMNTLEAGEILIAGEELVSPNQQYALRYLKDNGNLALFDRKAKKTLWVSGTAAKSTWRCVMLKDGNFVVFDAQQEIVWQTNTGRSGCDGCKLVLNDDGSLQIINAKDEPIWVRSKDVKNMTRTRSKRKR